MVALWFWLAFKLYKRSLTYLPSQVLSKMEEPQIEPRRHLIAILSTCNWKIERGEQTHIRPRRDAGDIPPVPVDENIDRMIAVMERFPDGSKASWEQLLRGIRPHLKGELASIDLVCSTDKRGSSAEFEDVKLLLSNYTKATITNHGCESFEDVESLLEIFAEIINDRKYKANEVMIDVTGGQKPTSIAGAIFTLDRPEIQFQYVSTGGTKSVMGFNVVSKAFGKVS